MFVQARTLRGNYFLDISCDVNVTLSLFCLSALIVIICIFTLFFLHLLAGLFMSSCTSLTLTIYRCQYLIECLPQHTVSNFAFAYFLAFICFGFSPFLFSRLENLLDEISAEVARPSSRNDEEELTIGSLCVARFTKDDKQDVTIDVRSWSSKLFEIFIQLFLPVIIITFFFFSRWYRAKIFSIRPGGEYDVFYVDYGDREWITKDRIMPAWSDILQVSAISTYILWQG